MSNKPVEIVQAAYAAFGRGDIPGVLDCLSDDVEWTHDGSTGEAYMRTARGKDDVMSWFAQVLAVDGIQAFEPRQFLAGPDHVTVLGWERTRALPNGGVFESNWVHVWQLRDGKLARFYGMFDSAAAAKARASVHA
ncbi:nuclear transport factor 2 family protein [Paucibacter soli]|uniref:nuclear transport factor 2 family protein n=1 Tax=Paucibacter soli TaxID=3133433 RepID=UPI0030AA3F76